MTETEQQHNMYHIKDSWEHTHTHTHTPLVQLVMQYMCITDLHNMNCSNDTWYIVVQPPGTEQLNNKYTMYHVKDSWGHKHTRAHH